MATLSIGFERHGNLPRTVTGAIPEPSHLSQLGGDPCTKITSDQIYGLNWSKHMADEASTGRLLATGYSCRSQAKTVNGHALRHPAQALLACLRGDGSAV